MLTITLLLAATFQVPGQESEVPCPDESAWREAMAEVHARFKGQKGTFAQFGDSITVSLAFWSPLQGERRSAPPDMERAYQRVQSRMLQKCWRDWKGPEFGSEGGQTIGWARDNIDAWLERLNPEVALLMFGTNDLTDLTPIEYRKALRIVVRRCLDNGTVVILSTIPPRHGLTDEAEAFADAAREVAQEMSVPLVDYHDEILLRRPHDWDGASEQFREHEGYDVPTLISRDGVHPSAPRRFEGDFSEAALRSHGYGLRNYLVLMAYAAVIDAMTSKRPAVGTSREPAAPEWYPQAPPLPPPTKDVVRVANADELARATRRVPPGGTILLADGKYSIEQTLVLAIDNVTLRAASGIRERVILDGGGTLGELLTLRRCSGVTIADVTLQNVRWNGIKLDSDSGVQKATIRNCVFRNIWQRGIKGVKVPEEEREAKRPRDCVIEYCYFTNDRPKQFSDDPSDTPEGFGGNYVGGIDVMYASHWTIRDNVFAGIRGRSGEARGAIFLWHDTRDCIVERNIIVDCDSGICLGNSHKPDDVPVHCTGVVVRNNFVCRTPETGILADSTRDCEILHNTVHDPGSRLRRLIRLVHDNDGLGVVNNLLSGPPPSVETKSPVELHHNVSRDLTAAFVAPAEGNLHLTKSATAAIDQAAPLPDVLEDIDRQQRCGGSDLGADELML